MDLIAVDVTARPDLAEGDCWPWTMTSRLPSAASACRNMSC